MSSLCRYMGVEHLRNTWRRTVEMGAGSGSGSGRAKAHFGAEEETSEVLESLRAKSLGSKFFSEAGQGYPGLSNLQKYK